MVSNQLCHAVNGLFKVPQFFRALEMESFTNAHVCRNTNRLELELLNHHCPLVRKKLTFPTFTNPKSALFLVSTAHFQTSTFLSPKDFVAVIHK